MCIKKMEHQTRNYAFGIVLVLLGILMIESNIIKIFPVMFIILGSIKIIKTFLGGGKREFHKIEVA